MKTFLTILALLTLTLITSYIFHQDTINALDTSESYISSNKYFLGSNLNFNKRNLQAISLNQNNNLNQKVSTHASKNDRIKRSQNTFNKNLDQITATIQQNDDTSQMILSDNSDQVQKDEFLYTKQNKKGNDFNQNYRNFQVIGDNADEDIIEEDDYQQGQFQQDNNDEQFQNFQEKYSKEYDPEQQNFRLQIYQESLKRIQEQNQQEESYKLAENEYSDLSLQEFQQKYLMQDPPQMPLIQAPPMSPPPDFEIKEITWRDKMGKVKHQGKCGSCYSFSVVGVMEAAIKIKTNNDIELSTQQAVDCCKSGCNGCRGGWPVSTLQYIANKGIALSQDYPYAAVDQQCNNDAPRNNFINVDDPFSQVSDVLALAYALETGPVSVIMDATTWDPLYKSGVFDGCRKDKVSYNHAVICLGIDEQGNWEVRNSWGANWGDEGHILLPPGNSCGVADMGIIPNFASYDMGLGMAPPQ